MGSIKSSRARRGKREASLGRGRRPVQAPSCRGSGGSPTPLQTMAVLSGLAAGFAPGSQRLTICRQSTGFTVRDCPVPEARRDHGPDHPNTHPQGAPRSDGHTGRAERAPHSSRCGGSHSCALREGAEDWAWQHHQDQQGLDGSAGVGALDAAQLVAAVGKWGWAAGSCQAWAVAGHVLRRETTLQKWEGEEDISCRALSDPLTHRVQP